MGNNSYGQLGLGEALVGEDIDTPTQIVDSNVSEVFVSSYYTLFLKDNGSLWGMGDNFNGQLGLGESLLGKI